MAWEIVSNETVKVEDTNPIVWRDAANADIQKGFLKEAIEKLYKAKRYYGDAKPTKDNADSFLESCVPNVIKAAEWLSYRADYQKSTELIYDMFGENIIELSKYKTNTAISSLLARNYLKIGNYFKYVLYSLLYVPFWYKKFDLFLSIFATNFLAIILLYFVGFFTQTNLVVDFGNKFLAFKNNSLDWLLLVWTIFMFSPISAVFFFCGFITDKKNGWFWWSILVFVGWVVVLVRYV